MPDSHRVASHCLLMPMSQFEFQLLKAFCGVYVFVLPVVVLVLGACLHYAGIASRSGYHFIMYGRSVLMVQCVWCPPPPPSFQGLAQACRERMVSSSDPCPLLPLLSVAFRYRGIQDRICHPPSVALRHQSAIQSGKPFHPAKASIQEWGWINQVMVV